MNENFITGNAHSTIELNGHALIILLILMRDVIPNGNKLFCPWLLGSQPCEQTFRAARSILNYYQLQHVWPIESSPLLTNTDAARISDV